MQFKFFKKNYNIKTTKVLNLSRLCWFYYIFYKIKVFVIIISLILNTKNQIVQKVLHKQKFKILMSNVSGYT